MKKKDFVYQCKVKPDGRLYYGSWTHKSILPRPLPENELIFEEVPDTIGGGDDYIWNGEELIYSPLPEESEETNAENQD